MMKRTVSGGASVLAIFLASAVQARTAADAPPAAPQQEGQQEGRVPGTAPAPDAGQANAAASAAQSPTTAAAGDTMVGDIIVTAQRRQERLADVPLSVTAVTNEALERNRITDLSRVQLLTPGL